MRIWGTLGIEINRVGRRKLGDVDTGTESVALDIGLGFVEQLT